MITSDKTRILVIEDNQTVNETLSEYINNVPKLSLAGSYFNCEDAIRNLKNDLPRIILMDIDLPGMDGIEGTKKIKKLSPKTDVIIITVFENSENVFAALCAGATGYLTKNIDNLELESSIEECLLGGAPMSMKIAKMVINSFNKNQKSPLNERETEILTLLAQGKSYQSIAELIFVSKDNVKYHIKKIYSILQVDSKEEAIEVANKQKYI